MDGTVMDIELGEGASVTLEAVRGTSTDLPATLDALGEQARAFLDVAWCADHELAALPAEASTLVLYLTAHAGVLKESTLQRRLVSIAQGHRAVVGPGGQH
jgi:hypothetical protein